jgi:hypothetical protein
MVKEKKFLGLKYGNEYIHETFNSRQERQQGGPIILIMKIR